MTQDPGKPTKQVVHVLDDDASVRTALARLLRAVGYEVRVHASATTYLLEPPPEAPTCLVLDVRMPELGGLAMQQALAKRGNRVPIVFLTGHGDIPMSVQAMRAGAVDFLTKPVRREALVAAVRAAFARDIANFSDQAQRNELKARYDSLSEREREVFVGVVAGRLNKQIAAQLGIAERTVKAHRAQVMEKMRAESVADLVRQAENLRN
jgi:FixJ family two-component response regulator